MVGGDELQPVEDLQRIGIIDDVHPLPDVLLRHAVVVLVQRDVAVAHDGGRLARLHLVSQRRKRLQVLGLYLLEQGSPRLPASRQLAFVEGLKRYHDSLVQRCQVMERPAFHVSIDRPVHQLYGILYQCLILRMPHSRRIHGAVVELREGSELLIDDGLVLVASRHGRLQIVRDDGHRRSAKEVEGVLTGPDQILFLL